MGNPAARATDTATTCNDPADLPMGKVVAVGTVLINNLPAAKQGDKIIGIDTHIILVPSPGGPVPTPLPHPFAGTIDGALSSSVKIEGKAAATVNSTATNTPSHIPSGPGSFQKPPMNKATIILGSPNVLIGNGGGGSGSGSGSSSESQTSSSAVEAKEGHYLHAKFVDKGNKPVTGPAYTVKTPDGQKSTGILGGEIKKTGIQEGDSEVSLMTITKAEWSTKEAKKGDKVKMLAESLGFEDDDKADFEVFVRDINRADKSISKFSDVKLSSGKAEAEWELQYLDEEEEWNENKRKSYSRPKFYFMVKIGGQQQKSGMLVFKDWIEFELVDADDKPIKNAKYILTLSTGEVRKGQLDGNGFARVENVPPKEYTVEFPDHPGAIIKGGEKKVAAMQDSPVAAKQKKTESSTDSTQAASE